MHGYNNIVKTIPSKTLTVAQQLPINKLDRPAQGGSRTERVSRRVTLPCVPEDVAGKMGKEITAIPADTSPTQRLWSFQVARQIVIVLGLLKTVQANRKMPLPLKLFEISDVVQGPGLQGWARNERHLAAVLSTNPRFRDYPRFSKTGSCNSIEVPLSADKSSSGYYLRSSEDESCFPGRAKKL